MGRAVNHPPTDLARLLTDLGEAGVELAPHPTDPERLRHRPRALPPTLEARLRLAKGAVLAAIRGEGLPDPTDGTEAGYVLGERLGVADELELPTHPGAPAWLLAAGEGLEAHPNPPTPGNPRNTRMSARRSAGAR